MAITTYAELQTAISTWTGDTFTSAQVQEFIALVEARLNRLLRTQEMETRATATVSGEYLILPDDFLEQRSIEIGGDQRLEYVTPAQMSEYQTETGEPRYYTVTDGQFRFQPVPANSYSLEVVYYKKIPALAVGNTTNWVLDNHPDLYLASCLTMAEVFGWNDGRAAGFKAAGAEIIAEIESQELKRRVGSSPLKMRTGIPYERLGINR